MREHWCEQIKTIDINGNTMWASCDPFENECNGGSSIARVDDDEYLWTSTNDNLRSNLEWVDNLGFDDWIKIKYGKIDAATRDKIWKGCVSSKIPQECRENNDELENIGDAEDQSENDAHSNSNNVDAIMDYLELQGSEGFTDPDDETYEQRRCKLLGLPYKRPPPIIAETYEVTRYHVGANERFSKVRRITRKEYCRTATNVAWIRQNLMKEMDEHGQVHPSPT